MALERLRTRVLDYVWKHRLRSAQVRYHGRGLCSHCLNPLDWHNYQDREIQILPSTAIMLFCPECHIRGQQSNDGSWIETALRRWYTYLSGYGHPSESEAKYTIILETVLAYYGWDAITHLNFLKIDEGKVDK